MKKLICILSVCSCILCLFGCSKADGVQYGTNIQEDDHNARRLEYETHVAADKDGNPILDNQGNPVYIAINPDYQGEIPEASYIEESQVFFESETEALFSQRAADDTSSGSYYDGTDSSERSSSAAYRASDSSGGESGSEMRSDSSESSSYDDTSSVPDAANSRSEDVPTARELETQPVLQKKDAKTEEPSAGNSLPAVPSENWADFIPEGGVQLEQDLRDVTREDNAAMQIFFDGAVLRPGKMSIQDFFDQTSSEWHLIGSDDMVEPDKVIYTYVDSSDWSKEELKTDASGVRNGSIVFYVRNMTDTELPISQCMVEKIQISYAKDGFLQFSAQPAFSYYGLQWHMTQADVEAYLGSSGKYITDTGLDNLIRVQYGRPDEGQVFLDFYEEQGLSGVVLYASPYYFR